MAHKLYHYFSADKLKKKKSTNIIKIEKSKEHKNGKRLLNF